MRCICKYGETSSLSPGLQVDQGVRGSLLAACCLLKPGQHPTTVIALTTARVLVLNK